jgi:plastocyanin
VLAVCACSGGSSSSDAASTTTTAAPAVEVLDLRGKATEGNYPELEIRAVDSEFVDGAIRIDPGVTVRWANAGLIEHDVVAVGTDLPFGVDASEFGPGASYEQRFVDPGVYPYYCSLHGSAEGGMRGVVVVGDVEALVPGRREPPAGPPRTITVPGDQPSIQAAVDSATEGSLVLVEPGVYPESVTVTTDRLVIRGLDRDRTVLDGEHQRQNGVLVLADGVAVENLTARDYTVNGFFWHGVTGFRGSYLTALDNGFYGIYAFESRSGVFEHSYAAGSTDSGVYVGQCDPCDTRVDDVVAEHNDLGFSGVNASGGLSVVNSTFGSNRAGIVIATLDSEERAPQHDALVAGNVVDGARAESAPPRADGSLDLLYGMGIAVLGGLDDRIVRNRVTTSPRVGIAIAPNPAIQVNFWPVERARVEGNAVSGSGMYDLAFVPIPEPAGSCFSENVFGSIAPLDLEAAAPCDAVGTGAFDAGAVDLGAYLALTPPPAEPRRPSVAPPQPELPNAATATPAPAVDLDTTVDVGTIDLPPA